MASEGNGKDPVMQKLEDLAAQIENLTDTVNEIYEFLQDIGTSEFETLGD